VGLALPGNHPLASTLLVAAGAGTVLLGVLLVAGGLRDGRRVTVDDVDDRFIAPAPPVTSTPHEPAVEAAAAAATAAERAATARIAELEALLALEEQRLDEVIHALAAEDAVASAEDAAAPGVPAQPDAGVEEPVLRAQVVDTLVELIGEKDVVRELEILTTRAPSPPAEPPAPAVVPAAASEEKRLQKPRAKRRRVEKPGPVDKRAERVGKRDLRRGRARDTQQVGRTDEDG
jgi:hypothetical protein